MTALPSLQTTQSPTNMPTDTPKNAEDADSRVASFDLNTSVATPYGDGKLLGYRSEDGIFAVRLPFGLLYAVQESLGRGNSQMQLEKAYSSLEEIRKLNFEVECNDAGVPIDYEVCTICLFGGSEKSSWIPSLSSLQGNKKTEPCLVCGNPTCGKHQSSEFKKQKVLLCCHCEELFEWDFRVLLGLIPPPEAGSKSPSRSLATSDPMSRKALRARVQQLLDLYERAMIKLTHATRFLPALQQRLIETEKTNNRVGAGTAGAGIMAGALGLAGAATLLTPAGPPLLLASLAFSGSSAAVSFGHGTMQYYQRPYQAADQILVLHGVVSALLKAARSLQSIAIAVDPNLHEQKQEVNDNIEKASHHSVTNVVGEGLTTFRKVDTGVTLATAAANSSAAISSAAPNATNLLNSSVGVLNAVPFLGAALSGIFMTMDANRLQVTLAKIKAGDPSDKAEMLRKIHADLLLVPQTSELDRECQVYLESISKSKLVATD